MSSLARYLRDAGAEVTGSDAHLSPLVEKLISDRFSVRVGENAEPDGSSVDIVVHTAAVAPDHPEVRACCLAGAARLKYSEMLGRVIDSHKGVAVAGTHGKTTVASLIAFLLKKCGLDPSFVLGGTVSDLGGVGGAGGRGRHFVVEACEYDRSFLNLSPSCIVLLNVEEDHLDYYKDIDDLRGAFASFAGKLREGGEVIAWHEIPYLDRIIGFVDKPVRTFGFEEGADLVISNVTGDREGSFFDLTFQGARLGTFRFNTPGRHSVLNAAAAILAALQAGAHLGKVREAVSSFCGVARRLERVDRIGDCVVYSDYAHHPTEISAVFEAMRTAYPGRRLVTVFQAHQRSRTAFFFDGLADALAQFDLSVLVETFSVRETGVDHLPGGEALADAVAARNGQSSFLGSLHEAPARLPALLEEDDVVVLMGAGEIGELAQAFAGDMRRHQQAVPGLSHLGEAGRDGAAAGRA